MTYRRGNDSKYLLYRGRIDARDTRCPTCQANVGCYCRTASGGRAIHYHAARANRSRQARRQLGRWRTRNFLGSLDRIVRSNAKTNTTFSDNTSPDDFDSSDFEFEF